MLDVKINFVATNMNLLEIIKNLVPHEMQYERREEDIRDGYLDGYASGWSTCRSELLKRIEAHDWSGWRYVEKGFVPKQPWSPCIGEGCNHSSHK